MWAPPKATHIWHSSILLLWSWNAGLIQAPQLHCIPAQSKEPKRAWHPIQWSFSSTIPSSTAPNTKQASKFSQSIHIGGFQKKLRWITCLHPLHRLHKDGGTFNFITFPIFSSLPPLETLFSLTTLVYNNIIFWGNDSPTLFATIDHSRLGRIQSFRRVNHRFLHFLFMNRTGDQAPNERIKKTSDSSYLV